MARTRSTERIGYVIDFETTVSCSRSAGYAPLSVMDKLVSSVAERIRQDPGDLVRVTIRIAPDLEDIDMPADAAKSPDAADGIAP